MQNEVTESKSAFARRVGKSASQISRYCQSGMPVDTDGSVPVETALAWLRQHVGPPQDGQDGSTLAEKKAEKLEIEIQRLQLELDRERGDLVNRERAERLVFDMARQVRDAWQTWPARAAPEVAAELGVDMGEAQRVLQQQVEQHLRQMSSGLEFSLHEDQQSK